MSPHMKTIENIQGFLLENDPRDMRQLLKRFKQAPSFRNMNLNDRDFY